jgi:hypothetical protein
MYAFTLLADNKLSSFLTAVADALEQLNHHKSYNSQNVLVNNLAPLVLCHLVMRSKRCDYCYTAGQLKAVKELVQDMVKSGGEYAHELFNVPANVQITRLDITQDEECVIKMLEYASLLNEKGY